MSHFQSTLAELEALFASRGPELEIIVRDPALDVEGYCVCWNTRISVGGPLDRCAKGGTRVTPDLTPDVVRMLASRMALKNAAAGLPLGGAKSGLRAACDDPDIEIKYRRFVELLAPVLRENGGIFGGFGWDVGARPEYVQWACDTLHSTRSFTGKPVEMGGSDYDREGIAGLGVVMAARTLIESRGIDFAGQRCAIQGIGAMGAAVVKYAAEFGATITSIADPRIGGTCIAEDGFSDSCIQLIASQEYPALINQLEREKCTRIALDESLFQACDILFPCALQDVITIRNYQRIKASFVVEGANNPTEQAAYEALHARGVGIVPDIIANPGGIIAAFVELTTDITPEENARTRQVVEDARALTCSKIPENVIKLIDIVQRENVAPNIAGRYIALCGILQ